MCFDKACFVKMAFGPSNTMRKYLVISTWIKLRSLFFSKLEFIIHEMFCKMLDYISHFVFLFISRALKEWKHD